MPKQSLNNQHRPIQRSPNQTPRKKGSALGGCAVLVVFVIIVLAVLGFSGRKATIEALATATPSFSNTPSPARTPFPSKQSTAEAIIANGCVAVTTFVKEYEGPFSAIDLNNKSACIEGKIDRLNVSREGKFNAIVLETTIGTVNPKTAPSPFEIDFDPGTIPQPLADNLKPGVSVKARGILTKTDFGEYYLKIDKTGQLEIF